MVGNRSEVGLKMKRGQIVIVDFNPVVGSEQGRIRPALIIQNDVGNRFSPLTIVAPITSRVYSREFPTNVHIGQRASGLKKESTILLNQIRTIDKSRVKRTMRLVDGRVMDKVDLAIKISLGLD